METKNINKKNTLKKLECLITEKKEIIIQAICDEENYTRAELIRRALDEYIEKRSIKLNNK